MIKYRIAVVLLGVIGYALTMARSVSFWDCGEYIAAANVLGIPHPPGNPLFVMLGRVFILLFNWINGAAFAVNMLSAASSILCCLLIFEITAKILSEHNLKNQLGFFAASISLFGNTFWSNAIEAGAYSASMLVIMLQILAALKWKETAENKYLVFILYLAFLGLGIHTFALLPLPAILIFVLIKTRKFSAKLLGAAVFFIALGLSVQLYLPLRSSTEPLMNQNNPAEIENFWEVLNRKIYGDMNMFERALYRRGALINQFGFSENIGYLGYHFNQWIPAPLGAQRPGNFTEGGAGKLQFFHRIIFNLLIIAVFTGVWLQRKNLGAILITIMFLLSSAGLVFYLNMADGTKPESYMVKQWNAQIKELRQFVPDSIPNLPSLGKLNAALSFYNAIPPEMRKNWLENAPTAKGLRTIFAWGDALEEHGKEELLPPKNVRREVRNRDYFFMPAFLFFAIMSAVACAAVTQKQRLKSGRAAKFAMLAFMFAWTIPFAFNFNSNNRSKDFIARDFAMNVLNSVPQNGILITYGDNDTYPLWCMQFAENYRRDVVVINESLSYSGWYKEQILRQYSNLNGAANGELLIKDRRDFISRIIEKNFPERSVSFMLGANPKDYAEFSEDAPIVGLVRRLGMEKSAADSLLIANLTANYSYSEFKTGGQEANEQTIYIYRYLAKMALEKEPDKKQEEILRRLFPTSH